MMTVILVLVALAVAAGATFFLMKTGKIEDKDNNNIPDVIEDKIEEAKEVVKEVKEKTKRVVEETKDVVKAAKEVVKQTKDVVTAAKGSGSRKGRKPAAKK